MLPPEELDNQWLAHELIRLKLRIPIIYYLTNIHLKPLRRRWKKIHGESPPNGKLPESVRSFISDALSVASLSGFVSLYNRLDGQQLSLSGAKLHQAWEMHHRLDAPALDINAAWYAIRDVRAGIVGWRRCPRCQASYIYEPNAPHARACPFCKLARV